MKVLLDTNVLLRLAVASHPTHVDAVSAVQKVRQRGDQPVLLRDERGIFANWLADVTDLAISGKRAHDARLVAAMQRHGLQQIVTFNKSDFNGFPNLTVFLPHEVA